MVALSAPEVGEWGAETVDHRPRGLKAKRRGAPMSYSTFPERVDSGQAAHGAEDLVGRIEERAEIIGNSLDAAWNQIIETLDDLLVDMISRNTGRVYELKPEPERVEPFLAIHVRALTDALEGSPRLVVSPDTNAPSASLTYKKERGPFSRSLLIRRLLGPFAPHQGSVA